MQAPTVKCRDCPIHRDQAGIPLRSESFQPTGELNAPTEAGYQTNKITNIFHRETLSPFYYSISTNNLKMSAKFEAYRHIMSVRPKKMVEIKCKIGVAHFSPDFIGIQIALNPR